MDKVKEYQDKAEAYFNSGFNCCESVVMAVRDYAGIKDMTAVRIATPFGTGMSRNSSTCGALSAAFISMGMINGRQSNDDNRDLSYLPSDRIFNKFKEKYGTTVCGEITHMNFRDPEEVASKKEWLHNELCGPIVKQVTAWILEELETK